MGSWLYSEETANSICERLMDGLSLRQICQADDMPDRVTVMRWMEKDPAFATRCARAREMQADLMDDMILEVANNCTAATALADRVKISAYQWRASKLQPKRFGEKVQQEISGPDGGPIETAEISATERARRIAFALAKGAKAPT